MSYVQAIFQELAVQAVAALLMLGFVLAVLRWPKNSISRGHALSGLWIICFLVLGIWTMQQERMVLASPQAPSEQHPIGIVFKGAVRFVSEDLYYRHDASMGVLIVAMIVFLAIYKLAGIRDEG